MQYMITSLQLLPPSKVRLHAALLARLADCLRTAAEDSFSGLFSRTV